MLSGVPGVAPAKALMSGGGIVDADRAQIATGLGAEVTITDVRLCLQGYLDDIMPSNVTTLMSAPHIIRERVKGADLVIGAVLRPRGRTPQRCYGRDGAAEEVGCCHR